jgi:predicted TIM-barrel fold metal-dependent hydrolase
VAQEKTWHRFLPKKKLIFFLCVLNRFDVLILKIIFKKYKNIILIHFGIKNTLKNNRKHTNKQCLYIYFGVYHVYAFSGFKSFSLFFFL